MKYWQYINHKNASTTRRLAGDMEEHLYPKSAVHKQSAVNEHDNIRKRNKHRPDYPSQINACVSCSLRYNAQHVVSMIGIVLAITYNVLGAG